MSTATDAPLQPGAEHGPLRKGAVGLQRWLAYPLGVLVLLAALGTLCYLNTFSAPFSFDDELNIVKNSRIRQLTGGEAMRHRFTGSRDVGFGTFAVNYAVGGLNVEGYHLFNLLIHITNSWLVYALVMLLLRTPGLSSDRSQVHWVAVTSALLFVTHPIQTQAVTYIVQRFTSLATLFYLLAIVCYLQWCLAAPATRYRFAWYAGTMGATILAMKTKEISFTLPVMLVLVAGVGFGFRPWTQWKPLVPFLLTLPIIPFSYSGDLGEAEVGWARETTEISRWSYLVTQCRVLVTYLRLMIWPIHQNLDYDYPLYHSLLAPPVLLSFLVLCGLLGLAVYLLRTSIRWRVVGFGVLWFFLTLSVESSLIPIRDVIFEHRLYLPSVGVLLAGSAIAVGLGERLRVGTVLGVGVVVALLAIATYQRNRVWHDEVTLWSNVVAGSPQKARAHNNLGVAYEKQGQVVEAIAEYLAAIKFSPTILRTHNSLGVAYAKQGRWEEAIQAYLAEITLNPHFPDPHYNLGNAYARQERLDDAVKEYVIAVKAQPDRSDIHNNLGNAYVKQGRVPEAMREYNTAIRLDSDSPDAHHNLGNVYAGQTRLDEAVTEFLVTLRLDPKFVEAHYSLGRAYHRQGRREEAIKEFLIGLRLDPDRPNEHYDLGNIYAEQGQLNDAIQEYGAALRLKPDFPDAHNNLGILYARHGRSDKAMAEFAAALQLQPEFSEAHYNLGSAYARQGRLDEAIREYLTALRLKPGIPEVHYDLGNAYQLQGHTREARRHFELAVRLQPDFTLARHAIEALDGPPAPPR